MRSRSRACGGKEGGAFTSFSVRALFPREQPRKSAKFTIESGPKLARYSLKKGELTRGEARSEVHPKERSHETLVHQSIHRSLYSRAPNGSCSCRRPAHEARPVSLISPVRRFLTPPVLETPFRRWVPHSTPTEQLAASMRTRCDPPGGNNSTKPPSTAHVPLKCNISVRRCLLPAFLQTFHNCLDLSGDA